jgi:hypothetical protein
LINSATGASRVIVFDHSRLNIAPSAEILTQPGFKYNRGTLSSDRHMHAQAAQIDPRIDSDRGRLSGRARGGQNWRQ